MIQERINRVINNHQLSCGHTSHYLYILKGFEPVLESLSVPVSPLDVNALDTKQNFYVTYEAAFSFDDAIINTLKDYDYDLWIVDFNWFDSGYYTKNKYDSYTSSKPWHDGYFVDYPRLEFVAEYKVIAIFNTHNPLTRIVDETELDNEKRWDVYQSWLK